MRLWRPIIVALLCALTTAPAAGAATFKPISTDGLGLTKTGLDDAAYGQIAALEKTHPKASVGDVIASANRSVRPLGSSPALRAVKNVQGGFRWNAGDDDVSYWYRRGSPARPTPPTAASSTGTVSCSSAGTPRTARARGSRS